MTRAPALFVSHGSPMFAVEPGRLGPQLAELGSRLGGARDPGGLAALADRRHPRLGQRGAGVLVAAGASDADDPLEALDGGLDGVLSMDSYAWGRLAPAAARRDPLATSDARLP